MCGPNAFSARSHAAGAKVTDVARRNDVATNLLHCWHLADVEGPLCARSGRSALNVDASYIKGDLAHEAGRQGEQHQQRTIVSEARTIGVNVVRQSHVGPTLTNAKRVRDRHEYQRSPLQASTGSASSIRLGPSKSFGDRSARSRHRSGADISGWSKHVANQTCHWVHGGCTEPIYKD
jgi:hypothetical protein